MIAQAVTRGLDPAVELKDSGIRLVGEIPVHWPVNKLSRVFSINASATTPPAEGTDFYRGDVPGVTTGQLRENVIFEATKTVTHEAVRTLSAWIACHRTVPCDHRPAGRTSRGRD